MQPGAPCSTTICRLCAALCETPPRTTTSFQLWSRPSFALNNSECVERLNPRWRVNKGNPNRRINMYIFKKHISRRKMLKGIGASIALPLLDAMSPAATAWAQTPAAKTPKRLAFIGFPHGAIMDKWVPKQTGTDYELSPILEPLA